MLEKTEVKPFSDFSSQIDPFWLSLATGLRDRRSPITLTAFLYYAPHMFLNISLSPLKVTEV
jgi:hypothetical protein